MYLILEFKQFIEKLKIINNFKIIRQDYDYDCGIACIRMILNFYKINASKEEIIDYIKPKNIEENGVSPTEIIKGFKNYKINTTIKHNNSIEKLKKYVDNNQPVICIVQAYSKEEKPNYKDNEENGHYLICIGYNKNKLIFADPSSTKKVYLTDTEMLKRWHDIDKNNNKFNKTIIVPETPIISKEIDIKKLK